MKSNKENFNHGERYYGPKENLNGCDIYGCNTQGNIKLKTYEPNLKSANIDFPQFTDLKNKELKLNNFYPESNEIELNYYNSSNIMISAGLAVVKQNIKEAIDIANKDIQLLDYNNFNKNKITNFNITNNYPTFVKENPKNILPFVNYLLKIINNLGNNFHVLIYKNIKNLKKAVVDNQIRLNFDIICRYKYNIDDKFEILLNFQKNTKLTDSLQDLIIRTELILTKNFVNNETYVYVTYMYLVGYQDILPHN